MNRSSTLFFVFPALIISCAAVITDLGQRHNHDSRIRIYWSGSATKYNVLVRHDVDGLVSNLTTTSTSSGIYHLKCCQNYNISVSEALRDTPSATIIGFTGASSKIDEVYKINNLTANITWTSCGTRNDIRFEDELGVSLYYRGVQSPVILNMTENHLYTVTIIVVCKQGNASSHEYITTGFPGPITEIYNTKLSVNSLYLKWEESEYSEYYYVLLEHGFVGNGIVVNTTTSKNQLLIPFLNPGARFRITIFGANRIGYGPSYYNYQKTVPYISIVTSVAITEISNITITWSEIKDCDKYNVKIYNSSSQVFLYGVYGISGTSYNWKIPNYNPNINIYASSGCYDFNTEYNKFYSSNDTSRPYITEVTQMRRDSLLVYWNRTVDLPHLYIRLDSFINNTDYPRLSNVVDRDISSPWSVSLQYDFQGKFSTHFITIISDEITSETFTYTTEIPRKIEMLSLQHSSISSITLEWNCSSYSEVFWVYIRYNVESSGFLNSTTNETNIQIDDLTTGRVYKVKVFGENPAGLGIESSLIVKTDMDKPSVNKVEQTSLNSVEIHWTHARNASYHVLRINHSFDNTYEIVDPSNPFVYISLIKVINVTITAYYEVGNISSQPFIFGSTDPCTGIICAGNASCHFDRDSLGVCTCNKFFIGDGDIKCNPYCEQSFLGTVAYSLTTCKSADCEQKVLNEFSFQMSFPGTVAYSLETCNSGRSQASIFCDITQTNGVFGTNLVIDSLTVVRCGVSIGITIHTTNFTSENEIEKLFGLLHVLTSNPLELTQDDVQAMADLYSNIVKSEVLITHETLKYCVLTTSHLIDFYKMQDSYQDHKESFLKNLQILARRALVTESTTRMTWISKNVYVEILDSSIDNIQSESFIMESFSPIFYHWNNTGDTFLPVRLDVPYGTFEAGVRQFNTGRSSTNDMRTVFLTYRNTALFKEIEETQWLTYVELGNKMQPFDLPTLNDAISLTQNKTDDEKINCMKWDSSSSTWLIVGVTSNLQQLSTCHYNSLGYYAFLKSHSIETIRDFLGCCISICGFLFTIFAVMSQRNLKKSLEMQSLLHYCAVMIVFYVTFLHGVNKIASKTVCALIQFCFIQSWTWILLYVYGISLSSTQNKEMTLRRILIYTFFAYTLPSIIVAFSYGITVGRVDASSNNEGIFSVKTVFISVYRSAAVCWVHGLPLYGLSLFFIGGFLIWICFTSISTWRNNKENVKQKLASVIIMGSTNAFMWGFATTTALTGNEALKWIFFVVNFVQGFIIMLVVCVGNEKIRQRLKQKFCDRGKNKKTMENKIDVKVVFNETVC